MSLKAIISNVGIFEPQKKVQRLTSFVERGTEKEISSEILFPATIQPINFGDIQNRTIEPQYRIENSTRRIALVTGATSGIGKEFAYKYAGLGYDLIITGRRKSIISQIASELRDRYHVNVKVMIVDLSLNKDMNRLLKYVEKNRNIEVLVNNAGFGMSEKFTEDEVNHQLKMLKVHVTAPLLLIHKVIPQMMNHHKGTIINVTSLAAYTPTPDNAMYTGTKSFLTNFSESLFMQLKEEGIRIQCLCPGFTRTDFHNKPGLSGELIQKGFNNSMDPADVVDYSLYCLDKGKILCVPGAANRLFVSLISIVPRRMYYFLTTYILSKIYENEKRKLYA